MKEPTAPSTKDRFYQDESSAKKTVNKIMSEMPTIDLFTTSQKNELFDKLMGLWHTGWKAGHEHGWQAKTDHFIQNVFGSTPKKTKAKIANRISKGDA